MQKFQIAIDGPSGSGKSTLAKSLSKLLGILYLDTGAMYRACGLKALLAGVSPKDETLVKPLLEQTDIRIRFENGSQRIYLDGVDVTADIRKPDVSVAASDISSLPSVRQKMVAMQREIASSQSVVLDGRDIGSYVLPDAEYKFFLTADPKERAKRRLEELSASGTTTTYDEVLAGILYRDHQDSTRAFAPLRKVEGAVEIDTTHNTLEQTLDAILRALGPDIGNECGKSGKSCV